MTGVPAPAGWARFLVGDVFDQLDQLPPESVDVAICSPPFLALRSYLPDSHPDKAREIGSEGTPAAFVDVLLRWTAAAGRVLAPHGSLVVELGDTYSGSGGAGGDYSADGLRAGQAVFGGSAKLGRTASGYPVRDANPRPARSGRSRPMDTRPDRARTSAAWTPRPEMGGGAGWPLDKSLAGIPFAYMLSLAYGRNVLRAPLTGAEVLAEVDRLRQAGLAVDVAMDQVRHLVAETGDGRSPAGRWRVRTVKAWIRSNPPVGALGDKERPATSYVVVATRDPDRYFDLDAVRTAHQPHRRQETGRIDNLATANRDPGVGTFARGGAARGDAGKDFYSTGNPAGAPPRDWVHTVDLVLDAELERHTGRDDYERTTNGPKADGRDGKPRFATRAAPGAIGARGVHLRRALERAGILTTLEALDVSPKGYAGAHYAVWPPELVRLLLAEMCPPRVCTTCGRPSRRLVATAPVTTRRMGTADASATRGSGGDNDPGRTRVHDYDRTTTGWSDCGHGTWRPGCVLDPFAGSGTTLAVASGMGFDSIGIDIDYRNASLALDRVGMFLDVTWPEPRFDLPALGPGAPHRRRYAPWLHLMDDTARHVLGLLVGLLAGARHDTPHPVRARAGRTARNVRALVGQTDLFATLTEETTSG